MGKRRKVRFGSTGRPIHPGVKPKPKRDRGLRPARKSIVVLAVVGVLGSGAIALASTAGNNSPQCTGSQDGKWSDLPTDKDGVGDGGYAADSVKTEACGNLLKTWLNDVATYFKGLVTSQETRKSDATAWKEHYEALAARYSSVAYANAKIGEIKTVRDTTLVNATEAADNEVAAAQTARAKYENAKAAWTGTAPSTSDLAAPTGKGADPTQWPAPG